MVEEVPDRMNVHGPVKTAHASSAAAGVAFSTRLLDDIVVPIKVFHLPEVIR